MLYSLIRWVLFQLPAETSHQLTLYLLTYCHRLGLTAWLPKVPSSPVKCFGLTFENAVGLAAGLDKNGDYIDALAALGFGFIEIGTVTPRPQPGNPKPRLFRLPHKMAIINRMGFNNKGVDHLVEQVKKSQYSGVIGINIGKNFDTPVENALDDYLYCLEKVYGVADYIVINISSPNTQGLRSLQHGDSLGHLLAGLNECRQRLAETQQKQVPLLLKIAPDLTDEDLQNIARVCLEHKVDGVIATNTTLSRDGVEGMPFAKEKGGLSGGPLFMKSTQVQRKLCTELGGKIPVVGVGGVAHRAQALEKMQAGAELIQVYSGFIYQGPSLIRDCVIAIADWKGH